MIEDSAHDLIFDEIAKELRKGAERESEREKRLSYNGISKAVIEHAIRCHRLDSNESRSRRLWRYSNSRVFVVRIQEYSCMKLIVRDQRATQDDESAFTGCEARETASEHCEMSFATRINDDQ